MHRWGPKQVSAIKRLFRFFQFVKSKALVYLRPKSLTLVACCDAAYANGPGCRSTAGYVIGIGSLDDSDVFNTVDHYSGLVKATMTSSTMAEIYALYFLVCCVVWSRLFLAEAGFPQSKPTVIRQDNSAVISLSKNPIAHKKTKNLLTRMHYIRDMVETGQIELVKGDTNDMVSDMFTKVVPAAREREFTEFLQFGEADDFNVPT